MTDEEKDIELLDGYLQNTLGAEEQSVVEARLQNDSAFQQMLEDLKILKESIRQSSRAQLKQELAEIEKKISTPADGKTFSFRPWIIGVAASVLLLVVTFLLWPKPTNSQELFAQYFEPYPNVIMPTVRGSMELDSNMLAQAYRAYDSGNYQKAISLFEQVKSKNEGVYLYLGNSYLADNDPEKAIECFEIELNNYKLYTEPTQWLLSLSYLKANRLLDCKKTLFEIIESKGAYASKANDLLTKLDKL